jgi:hypothetical protein
MIYALWHGGASYSPGSVYDFGPDEPSDVETFDSIADAGRALTSRAERGYWERQTFRYADGRTEHTLTPAADAGPSMTLWHHDPRGDSDPYPDRILTIGPRGGIRQETC